MTIASSSAPTVSVACIPGAIPPSERSAHFELLARLGGRARDKRGLPDGYAYRFDSGDFDDIVRWIANERRCCPFLRYAVELEPDGGAIWVRLTGPAGTREFLDVKFPRMASSATPMTSPVSATTPRRDLPLMPDPILQSVLRCPHCGHAEALPMPTDACVFFHQCAACQAIIRPKAGDCCVFCSFGSEVCPPMQAGGSRCCGPDNMTATGESE